ncbi:NADH:flavin oxidoreductase/NADH oxidase [Citricoccus sp. SGAir0253]|uniref:NADH:flavin oxidoreductase/NADH oxidase n=1 Tax=Citricoccus sp. SGAir0253 TaxID=2567881 RepID=UPI0010CCB2C9|nr:NADH:flavin oxidoreductase/NADH oxidase [Citricoccus sp. SGAir0253]QCU78865.1 NADH:flavin oxidoreductase/NADH oxidase [Citricoccus sp. SGAir0253]
MTVLLDPVQLAGRTLRNRLVLPPMCQYTVTAKDGVPGPWHLAHLGARAAGGFGMVVAEATAVTAEGRISDQDTGLWNDAQRDAWAPIADFIRSQGALPAVQLAHAGSKASTWPGHPGYPADGIPLDEGGWETVSPSGIPAVSAVGPTRELTGAEIEGLVEAFAAAARRADEAGFEAVQVHGAHGYIIHQFLSPVTNHRTDEWGGSFENRTRFVRRVVEAVRAAWPADKVLGLRLSGSDWLEGSWGEEDTVRLVRELVPLGLDWVDVSSGGIGDTYHGPKGPAYQVPLAEAVRTGTADLALGPGRGTPDPDGGARRLFVSAVGSITDPELAESVVAEGRADAVCIGRAALVHPNWPVEAAESLGNERYRQLAAPAYHRGSWGRVSTPLRQAAAVGASA